MNKITVIGVGNLGSCVAYEIANRGLAEELVLVDVYRELAEGNAADIEQSLAFRNNVKVFPGDYSDADGSDVIVVTAGKPRTPDVKSRMELLDVNRRIIKDVASNLRKIKGDFVIITLTNPVDIMNFLMWKYTGFDRSKVIGSAGMLDSSRFRGALSKKFNVPVLDVNAYVIGEHGENQVPVFSRVKVRGKKKTFTAKEQDEIMNELRNSALNVISKKGATIFAPSNNTANLVQAVIRNEDRMLICSAILKGEYRTKDVSIGVPVIIGRCGVEKILEWELKDKEEKAFLKGAEEIKKATAELSNS